MQTLRHLTIALTAILLANCATAKPVEISTDQDVDYSNELRVGADAYIAAETGSVLKEKPNKNSRKIHLIKHDQKVHLLDIGWPPEEIDGKTNRWYLVSYGDWQGWLFGENLVNRAKSEPTPRFNPSDGCLSAGANILPENIELTCFGQCNGCERIRFYNENKVTFRDGCHFEGAWDGTWRIKDAKVLIFGKFRASGSEFYYDACGGSESIQACMSKADLKFKNLYGKNEISYQMQGSMNFNSKGEGILTLSATEISPLNGKKKHSPPRTFRSQNIGCPKSID